MEDNDSKFVVLYEPFSKAENYSWVNKDCYVEKTLNSILNYFNGNIRSLDNCFPQEMLMPYVFLSGKTIRHPSYGKYSEKDVLARLKKQALELDSGKADLSENLIGDFKECIFSIITKLHDKSDNKDAPIWEGISDDLDNLDVKINKNGNANDKKIFNDLIDLISNRKINNMLRLGEYFPDRHQIVLYLGSIEKEADDNHQSINALLSLVLSHEFFHAMHYALDTQSPLWNDQSRMVGFDKARKKTIKEALADCFSVLWCCESGVGTSRSFYDVADYRFNSWRKNMYSSWPYAKAILLMKDLENQYMPNSLNRAHLSTARCNICKVLENYRDWKYFEK